MKEEMQNFKEVRPPKEESEILYEIWERQLKELDNFQDGIETTVSEIESTIALEFRKHHKGMRFVLNSMENLASAIRKLMSEHEENREVLDILVRVRRY